MLIGLVGINIWKVMLIVDLFLFVFCIVLVISLIFFKDDFQWLKFKECNFLKFCMSNLVYIFFFSVLFIDFLKEEVGIFSLDMKNK